jgi:dihydroxy-acid dehydratase
VAPEATVGGPLALVRSGDRIRLSVKERRLDLLVDEVELARRDARPSGSGAIPPGGADPESPMPSRGYDRLFRESVLQAPDGCDFDFLRGQARSD